MSKRVLVTGARDHDCYVYLGSRSASKGQAALSTIKQEIPGKANMIEMIQIDVGDVGSCSAAAEVLKAREVKLYGLVNNAGVMSAEPEIIMDTNFMGPKRVTEALIVD